MTLAAKHMDPVVGIDMHMVQPPPPAPPVMMPVPFVGYLIDPADYAGGCTIHVNGLPRARAGTPGMGCPPHVPSGGMFVKPPTNECEMYQGSSTVVFDGDAATAMGHQVLGCHDVGMVAPVRGWKQAVAKSLMMGSCSVVPVSGAPVLVCGPPTITVSAVAEQDSREQSEPVSESIEVEVHDDLGGYLINARYVLHFLNGDSAEGDLDERGRMRVDDVPPSHALFILPAEENASSRRTPLKAIEPWTSSTRNSIHQTTGQTRVMYTVERNGQTVQEICATHSIVHWRSAYLRPANEELRSKRSNPNYLLKGDKVQLEIPVNPAIEYRRYGILVPTSQLTTIYIKRPPRMFQYSR